MTSSADLKTSNTIVNCDSEKTNIISFPKNALHHKDEFLLCFQHLCEIEKKKITIELPDIETSVFDLVEKLAKSCSYHCREIPITDIDKIQKSSPIILFDQETSMPLLLYYQKSHAFIYDPYEKTQYPFEKEKKEFLEPYGIFLFNHFLNKSESFFKMEKDVLSENKRDVFFYFILQVFIAFLIILIPFSLRFVFDEAMILKQELWFYNILFGLGIIFFTTTALKSLLGYVFIRLFAKSSHILQYSFLNKILLSPVSFFKKITCFNDLDSFDHIQKTLLMLILEGPAQIIFLISSLFIIFYFLPPFGLILLFITLLFLGIIFLGLHFQNKKKVIFEKKEESNCFLKLCLNHFSKTKEMAIQNKIITRWIDFEVSNIHGVLKICNDQQLHSFILGIVSFLSFLLLNAMVVNIKTTDIQHISFGTFLVLQFMLITYLCSIFKLGKLLTLWNLKTRFKENISTILKVSTEQETGKEKHISGNLKLDAVSFSYTIDRPILCNVSHDFEKGKWTAVIGPDGAGKSTLLNLMLGLITPSSGSILVDKNPLTTHDIFSFRKQICVLLQNNSRFFEILPELLGKTIFEIFLNVNHKITEKIIWEILEHVSLKNEIDKFSLKLHTGINKKTFSNGQYHRFLLALSFAKDSKIIILDDFFAPLDNICLRKIINTFKHLPSTRITFSNRLYPFLQSADRILVLDQKNFIFNGTFDEILNLSKKNAPCFRQ